MVTKLLSRNSEEVRRKRLEKDKLFNPRDLVTCGRSRRLPAPPETSAFALPYWPVNGTEYPSRAFRRCALNGSESFAPGSMRGSRFVRSFVLRQRRSNRIR